MSDIISDIDVAEHAAACALVVVADAIADLAVGGFSGGLGSAVDAPLWEANRRASRSDPGDDLVRAIAAQLRVPHIRDRLVKAAADMAAP